MIATNEYPMFAGLYCRISREDDSTRETSTSIENQKQKLIDFAEKSNMQIHNVYCDDGFSGTNFNRPAFINLLKDIEKGDVNCVVVKDLSRLGREYIQSGQILENFLPAHRTRFIAIDDNIDLDPMSDTDNASMLIPFYNMINE
ncbi:MAG: recombinase family protein, partial [Oscillospiraceae bacterium]